MMIDLQGSKVDKIRRLTGEAIGRFNLIEENDRILVGLSGGKDSWILLHLLHGFRAVAPVHFEVIAATFDPGFPEFRTSVIAEECCKRGWAHHIITLPMEQILVEHRLDSAPCGLCSRLRRGKLYGLAGELHCNKLALGQHLDDLIASFFMSLCRGQGIRTMAPKVRPKNPEHPTVIRPLALVPEELLKQTAEENHFPAAGICRYEETVKAGDRAYFRALTDRISEKIPDFRSNFIRSLGHVEPEHLLMGTSIH